MKKLTLFAFLLFSCLAFAQTQAVRFGDGEPVLSNQTIPGYGPPFITGVSNAQINFCQAPANAVPCTNLATTYTDSTASTACSLSQQVVLDGTTTCVTTTDTRGNWGVWALPGQYAYTVTVSGTSYGPFFATLGGASGGGGGGTVIPGAANDILASAGNSTSILVDTGKITINPTTHFLNAYGFQSNSGLPFILNGLPSGSACTAGPSGQVQYAFCPGPLATLSYNSDGPFPIQRYGLIGSTATQMPSSTYMPLDANGTMPLGSLGDVGWARINPGVMGLVNSASLTSPTRLNVYGGAGFGTNGQMVSLNYSTGFSAFQLTTDKNGSGGYTPLQLCTGGSANCGGWQISAGSTPGNLFPISQNTTPDIGSISNGQVRNLFLNGSAVNSGTYVVAYTNDSTGTQIGKLAKRSASQDANLNVEATIATTSDATGLLGVVVGESTGGTCGVGANCTTGVAYVATQGHTTAAFDGSTTLKHWAIASTSAAGDLSDSGTACSSVPPTGVDVLGCIQGTNTGAGTYNVDLALKSASPTGVPAGVAAGSQLVSNGVSAAPAYQTKLQIDARDLGVDCTGVADASTILNGLTNNHSTFNGVALTFPSACLVNLASTWTIENDIGFTVRGVAGAGSGGCASNSNVPRIKWTGAAAGTMVDMEYDAGYRVENLCIDGNGLAGVGINVDKTGTCVGCVNATDGVFDRLFVDGYAAGGNSNANWVGMQFSAVSTQNVEDMHVTNSTFLCGTGDTSGVAAIVIGASPNAKNYQFLHNEIHQCAIGVWQKQGGMDLEFSELGTNGTDIRIDGWSDPNERVDNNLSESQSTGEKFLSITTQPGSPISVSGNNIPLNDTCAIEFSNSHANFSGNTFYAGFAGTGHKLCNVNGGGNAAYLTGGVHNNLSQLDLANIVDAQNFRNNLDIHIPPFGHVVSAPVQVPRSTGALFLDKITGYSATDTTDGLSFNIGGQQSALPCGLNSICNDEGAFEITGVSTPDGLVGTATGGTGTTYGFYVSAVDASANETLLRGGSPYLSISGPATLNGTSQFLTITGLGDPGAASCNIYAVNTANAIQVNQIATGVACTSSWSYQVNSYPSTWPITTAESPFNKTLSLILRGKGVFLQYGTPLVGYTDTGSTVQYSLAKSVLSATTGNDTYQFVDSTNNVKWGMNPNSGGGYAYECSNTNTSKHCGVIGAVNAGNPYVGSYTNDDFDIRTNFAAQWTFKSAANGGHFVAAGDNTHDIGANGASRPRNIYAATQFIDQVATGTAPIVVTSTTPVANLTVANHPEVFEAGVLTTNEKIYTNTQALTGGTATHTFANSFSYTSSSTFGCTCTDRTAAAACQAVPASATTVTLAGSGTDVLWLSCSGH